MYKEAIRHNTITGMEIAKVVAVDPDLSNACSPGDVFYLIIKSYIIRA